MVVVQMHEGMLAEISLFPHNILIRDGLYACSRVSRQWRRVTLPHLFFRIIVRTDIQPFLQFLRKECILASYVRVLYLSATMLSGKPLVIEAEILGSIVSSLPRLDCLTLSRIDVCNSETSTARPRTLNVSQLCLSSHPSLSETPIEADQSLIHTLEVFSSIQRLNIGSGSVEEVFTDLSLTDVGPKIENITVMTEYGGCCEPLVSQLLSMNASRNLTSLHVRCNNVPDLKAIGKLLNHAGANVKAVIIDFWWMSLEYLEIGLHEPGDWVIGQ